jgi:4-hydroxy-tetrahydrodipicolinate synthase
MSQRYEPGGIGVVNATAFTDRDQFNEEEYRRHVQWMVDRGIRFLQPAAATGQAMQLTVEEYARILRVTVDQVGDRAFVTAYSGRGGTADTIAMTKLARDCGAHATFIIQPFFTRPDPEGLYLHYRAVAEAVPDFPIVFYNNPDRAGINLPIEVMERLVNEYPNFVALKQANLDQFVDAVARLSPRIAVMPKAEKELLLGLALGSPGVVTFAGNIIPGELVEVLHTWQRGEHERARQLHLRLLPLINAIHIEPVPNTVVYMLRRLGFRFGTPRLPGHPVRPETARTIDTILADLGLA